VKFCFDSEISVSFTGTYLLRVKLQESEKKSMQIILLFTGFINTHFQIKLWEEKVIGTIPHH